MPDLRHVLDIESPRDRVWRAIAKREGVARWWTPHASGSDAPGGTLRFEFDTGGFGEFAVAELAPPGLVRWDCVANDAEEWVGTTLRFEVDERDGGSRLRFTHAGWREASDFSASCNYFWGLIMHRLKRLTESDEPLPS